MLSRSRSFVAVILSLAIWFSTLAPAAAAAGEPVPAGGRLAADPWAPAAVTAVSDDTFRLLGAWSPVRLADGRTGRRSAGAGAEAHVAFTGTGARLVLFLTGRAEFDWRVDGGEWQRRRLEGVGAFRVPVVDGLDPGAHTLAIRSLDRDLTLLGMEAESVPGPLAARVSEKFGKVAVTWTPPPFAVEAYEVLQWAGAAREPRVVAITTGLSHLDESPEKGAVLRYAVRARRADGRRTGQTAAGTVKVPVHGDWIRVSAIRGTARVIRSGSRGGPAQQPGSARVALARGGVLADAGLRLAADAAAAASAAEELALGVELAPGDQLEVGPDGFLEIELDGEQFIRLDAGTRLTIAEHAVDPDTGRQKSGFLALLGRIWVNLKRKLSPRSRFEVETPTTVMGVRGTVWAIAVHENQKTEAWLLSGALEARPHAPDGRPQPGQGGEPRPEAPAGAITLAAGESLVAEPGREPVRSPVVPARLPEFVQVEAIKAADEIKPELRQQFQVAVPEDVFQRAMAEAAEEARQRLELESRERQQVQEQAQVSDPAAPGLDEATRAQIAARMEAERQAAAEAARRQLEARQAELLKQLEEQRRQAEAARLAALEAERRRLEEERALQLARTPSAAHSAVTASPAVVPADGTSAATITVQVKNAAGASVGVGGATVALTATLGTLSAVTDHGNGTYTATLRSSQAGVATVTGTVNGAEIPVQATVTFAAGGGDAGVALAVANRSGQYSDTVTLEVTLSPAAAGKAIAFTVGGAPAGVGITDAAGRATVSYTVDRPAGTYPIEAASAGDGETGAAAGQGTLTVAAEDAVLAYTGSTVADGGPFTLAARLGQADDGRPGDAALAGSVRFTLRGAGGAVVGTFEAPVDAEGLASHVLPALSAEPHDVTVELVASGYYVAAPVAQHVGAAGAPGEGIPSGATSTLTASPAAIPADGRSTAAITVQLKDASGNPLARGGATVTLTTTLGSLSAVTDHGDGTYTATLQAGADPGTAIITGTVNGVALQATVTVILMPAGISRIWAGGDRAGPTNWSIAANWLPAGVPDAGDSVLIPAGAAYQPALVARATVAGLFVESGASLDTFGYTLTVTGPADVGGALRGAGTLDIAGSGVRLRGSLPNLTVRGAAAVSGATEITGRLAVLGTGANLDLAGQTVTVTGELLTAAGGTLTMQHPASLLRVGGKATFAGGSTAGLLTAGVLQVGGDFSQEVQPYGSDASYAASGSHRLVLNGKVRQTVFFQTPDHHSGSLSRIQDVEFDNPAGVVFLSNAAIQGTATIRSGEVTGDHALVSVTIGGALADAAGGRWQVANTAFTGANPGLPLRMATNATFAASVVFPASFALTGSLTVQASALAGGALTVSGNLIVSGAGANLNVNGQTVTVAGNLETGSGGTLTMQHPAGVLAVQGYADFHGGSTGGLLTAGVLRVGGDFFAGGGSEPASFAASGSHKVVFGGAAPQTVYLYGTGDGTTPSRFQDVEFTNAAGVVLAGDAQVNGTATVTAGSVTSYPWVTVTLLGTLVDPGGGWQVANTVFGGSGLQ